MMILAGFRLESEMGKREGNGRYMEKVGEVVENKRMSV